METPPSSVISQAKPTSTSTSTTTSHHVPSTIPASSATLTALKDITFGSFAGIVGKTIEYPFDTVKVRLQSQPFLPSSSSPLHYAGPLDCFRQSWKTDRFIGLYRGLSVPLVGAAAEMSSLFFSYRLIQDAYRATITEDVPFGGLLLCGAMSGTFTSLVLTPIELVKCKIQVPFVDTTKPQQPLLRSAAAAAAAPPSTTIASTIRHIYTHQGIPGFWHGQMGTLIRETGGSAAWFGSFEGVKLFFRRYNNNNNQNQNQNHNHSRHRSESNSLQVENEQEQDIYLWQRLLAGAAAGISYNFLFFPADTVKSRMQTEHVLVQSPKSFWKVGADLWKSQGLIGFYRGGGITVIRSIPSSALIFTIHDALMKCFP